MIQVVQLTFPPPNTPLIDPKGAMTNQGMSFFRALWNRTGQLNGTPYAVADNIASGGASQATATVLTADWNNVTAVGGGVLLPSLTAGQMVWVFNNDPAINLTVWPPVGASITYQSVNAGVNNAITVPFASLVAVFYFSNTSLVAA